MTDRDRMALVNLAVKDLNDAVNEYVKAKKESGNRTPYPGYDVPMHCSKESIKRRIKQLRQDLLLLEKGL